jgi:hypothetical protein
MRDIRTSGLMRGEAAASLPLSYSTVTFFFRRSVTCAVCWEYLRKNLGRAL